MRLPVSYIPVDQNGLDILCDMVFVSLNYYLKKLDWILIEVGERDDVLWKARSFMRYL